ncbi:MAG: ATPase, T2SS/T4P/T4SS family [Candidatus Hydrogenedentes bacterium]|nr:ATPase, T2SS/T4P/T4SS family [Candidatus Hydrogenedentota bacterium]
MKSAKGKNLKARDAASANGGAASSRPDSSTETVIDMEEAIALLKTTRPTFYRWLRAGKFRGMKTGRQWRFYRDDIVAFLQGEGPRIALAAPLAPLLETLTTVYAELGEGATAPKGQTDLEQTVYLTVGIAMRMNASDIHVQPTSGNEAVIRLRVDGVLHEIARFDRRLLGSFVEQWKTFSGVDLSPRPGADGRSMFILNEIPVDIRSSFVQSAAGECATMRLLWKVGRNDFGLDTLQISPEARERFVKSLSERTGLIVVTGPAGSGKTTTLYSAINHLASPAIKVMTAEDPVEMLLENTVQIPVRPDAGMPYAAVLTRIFRSDPDVVMIGEIRDREMFEICCKGAAVGHLMLTTLHVATAVQTLYRMADLLDDAGRAVFLYGGTVRLVLAQRLLRNTCPHCATPRKLPNELASQLKARVLQGGLDWDALPKKFVAVPGCTQCGKTGYRGRVGVAEALDITPAIMHALRSGAEAADIEKLAVEQGMITIDAQGLRLAATGETTVDEVLRVFQRT